MPSLDIGVRDVADALKKITGGKSLAELLLLPYQVRWIRDRSKLALIEKSRRVGIDYAEAYGVTESRITGARCDDYWYSSADETAAREFMEYIRLCAESFQSAAIEFDEQTEVFDSQDITVFRAIFPKVEAPNGKLVRPKVQALTSNPRTFRSKGGDVGLSEFAFHEQPGEMWKAASPATMWGGQIRVISTHNGALSKFNSFIEMGRRVEAGEARPKDMPWSLHRVTLDDAIADGLVELINAVKGTTYTREAFRAEVRDTCSTEDEFNEEYLCIPNEQEGSLLPYELMRPCVRQRAPMPTEQVSEFLANIAERAEGCSAIFAGCDIGRTVDRFVLWAIGKVGGAFRLLGVLVWQGRSFAEMQFAGDALMRAHFGDVRVRRLCVDATGLGMQLGETWETAFKSRVEAIQITPNVKDEIFPLLRRHIDERTTELPECSETLADHTSIRKTVTAAGKVRFAADQEQHGHADRATAHAMALHAADSAPATRVASCKRKPGGL